MLDITFEDAERGSLYMPFRLKEGDNTVPAAAGTYYYIYSNERTGYGVVSSTSELPGGQVKISRKTRVWLKPDILWPHQKKAASTHVGNWKSQTLYISYV